MSFEFKANGKFGLVAVENVYAAVPNVHSQLSDGTWVLPGIPVRDLGVWNEWLGSLAVEELRKANVVLLRDEQSDNPEVLDSVHDGFDAELNRLFYLLQLSGVLEYSGARILLGSSENSKTHIRSVGTIDRFIPSGGYSRSPITLERLEQALHLRDGLREVEASDNPWIIRGLNVLFDGLKQDTGQERLHQFVRSLEALILPDVGKTRKQFIRRCQTFIAADSTTEQMLGEAFDMRSDTEHLHSWTRALQHHPDASRENVALWRTRQMEAIATAAYTTILSDEGVRKHFLTEDLQAAFWNQEDTSRRRMWNEPFELASVHLVEQYDQWNRRVMTP